MVRNWLTRRLSFFLRGYIRVITDWSEHLWSIHFRPKEHPSSYQSPQVTHIFFPRFTGLVVTHPRKQALEKLKGGKLPPTLWTFMSAYKQWPDWFFAGWSPTKKLDKESISLRETYGYHIKSWNKYVHLPASSKWPYDQPNRDHLTPWKGHLKYPKQVTRGRTWYILQ